MNFGSFARYLPASNSPASSPRACSDFNPSPSATAASATTVATNYKCALSFILSPPSSPEPAASLNLHAPGGMSPVKMTIKRKRTESADLATSMQQLKATCPGV
ncbi:hypothetical protein Gpo141_00013911, partial [Globisporangium polare]